MIEVLLPGATFSKSTARVSSRKYFIPGCVGRGLDLDLRIRPAAASGPKWVGPSWAHVGGPKLGPSGWAHVGGPKQSPSGWAQVGGPKWVGPGYTDLAPLGLRSKNKVFKVSG